MKLDLTERSQENSPLFSFLWNPTSVCPTTNSASDDSVVFASRQAVDARNMQQNVLDGLDSFLQQVFKCMTEEDVWRSLGLLLLLQKSLLVALVKGFGCFAWCAFPLSLKPMNKWLFFCVAIKKISVMIVACGGFLIIKYTGFLFITMILKLPMLPWLWGEKNEGRRLLGGCNFLYHVHISIALLSSCQCACPRELKGHTWLNMYCFFPLQVSLQWILFHSPSCLCALSLSLLCPALLSVLQRTRLLRLSQFRNCWLLWEWVCVFECAHRAPVVSSERNSGLLCLFWGFSRRWKRIKWPCCKSDKGIYFVCKHSKQMMTSGYGMVFWMLASSLH